MSDARDLEESRSRIHCSAGRQKDPRQQRARRLGHGPLRLSRLQGKHFDSIHPSLQRQAEVNMGYGLYEVVPGRIYQVRGFDLSNISFIKGDTGWIVFDPLTRRRRRPRRCDWSTRSSASAR